MRRLLIRSGAIGDFILSLPALECLRADYTEVWAASQNVSMARFADRARPIAATGLDLLGLPDVDPPPALLKALAGFDDIVSWYGTNRPEFRAEVARLGLPVRFFPPLPETGAGVHAADFYLEQARTIACYAGGAVPCLPCPRRDSGCVVIHPFSGSPAKNWPKERFQELARALNHSIPVRWCAGPSETLAEAVRFEDVYELACWLATARLYIGNDSGITHLAAAVGTPVVALFGPTDPAVWAPRGAQVRIVGTSVPGMPMDRIPVATVLDAARRWLA